MVDTCYNKPPFLGDAALEAKALEILKLLDGMTIGQINAVCRDAVSIAQSHTVMELDAPLFIKVIRQSDHDA